MIRIEELKETIEKYQKVGLFKISVSYQNDDEIDYWNNTKIRFEFKVYSNEEAEALLTVMKEDPHFTGFYKKFVPAKVKKEEIIREEYYKISVVYEVGE